MHKTLNKLAGVGIILAVWQAIASLSLLNPIYFASPLEVLLELKVMLGSQSILFDFLTTGYRVLASMLLACLIGIPIGVALGHYTRVFDWFSGSLDFFRSIPPIVVYPLLLITLGPNDASRVGVAVLGGLTVFLLIIPKGMRLQSSIRKQHISRMGANHWQLFRYVIWQEALPHVMVALRMVASLALIVIVVTEMLVGARYGLGTRVQNVQITNNIPDLFATIIIIGLLGVTLNKGLAFLNRKLVFWKVT